MSSFRHRHLHEIFDARAEERLAVQRSLAIAGVFFSALITAAIVVGLTAEPDKASFSIASAVSASTQP